MKFCPLYSGSSGNSIFVSSGNTRILVDVGMAGKKITDALESINEDPKDIDVIFITHEHIDHIKGAGVLSRKYNVPIYANEATWMEMAKSIGNIKEENVRIFNNNESIRIGDLLVNPFEISHDSVDPVGYNIHSDSGKIASIVTDTGHLKESMMNYIGASDVILIEANYSPEMLSYGPYPYSLKKRIAGDKGHLSNEECGEAIVRIVNEKKGRHIYLGHLSKNNNYPELAYKTVENILNKNNMVIGNDLELIMAERNNPSRITII